MNWSAPSSEPALSASQLEARLEELIGAVLSARRTAAGIAQALAGEPRALQDFTLRWVAVTAKSSPELAYQFAALAPRAVAELGTAGAERWLLAAMDAYDREGLYRASAELKDLGARAGRAYSHGGGIAFEDAARVLAPFIAGLSGRRLRLEASDSAWTDTSVLYLPTHMSLFAEREQNFRVYKLTAAFLWAQARYGTFNLEPDAYPRDARDRSRLAFLETLRLAARFERELPGLYRDYLTLAQPAPGAEFSDAAARLAAPDALAADSLAELARLPDSAEPPHWPFVGLIDPERALAVRAERIEREKAALQRALASLPSDERAELGTEPGRLLDGDARFGAPPDVASLVESIEQDLGGIPQDYLRPEGERGYRAGGGERAEAQPEEEGADDGARLYDEWDYRRQHYRRHWCALRERDVLPGDPTFAPRTLERYRAQLRQLRRSFEALRGEDKRLRGEPFGDDIDLDPLVRARAELAAGGELSGRTFVRRARHERDMAVLFAVDMSGSTKGWINDCEREALVLLCEALEVLGDRYAVYGFSGITHKRCEVYRVKRFDEPYDARVRERIAGIQPLDYTRMGPAIRHLTGILAAVEARTRLLVTLSDGKPDDFSDGYRGEYGIEDTRQALIEAKRAGIHAFCITIDREAGEYLPRMYGAVNYTVVSDVARLPFKLADLYRRLTA
jgi:nitric oxide reductase NorD protein